MALKVLPPGFGRRADAAERFRREAWAAAKLHHTNIVPVFGVGEWQGTLYYAMQFIRGCGLDAIIHELRRLRGAPTDAPAGPTALASQLASGLLSAEAPAGPAAAPADLGNLSGDDYYRAAARLGMQAADALAHAHAHGVLHRDVKPSNLLLDDQGRLWVADFGLAKAVDDDDLTATGDLVGTLRYMAPERFAGRGDARSDVYALGATLYELLTLRPAFEAADRPRLIERLTRGRPVPPRQIDPAIPRDLETVVLKALAAEPRDRYAAAADLAGDLRNAVAGRPLLARRTTRLERTWRWCRRNPIVAGLTACLAVALVTVSGLFWQEERQRALADANALQAAADAARANEKSELARTTVDQMLSALGTKLVDTTNIPKVRMEMYEKALALYEAFAAEPGGGSPAVQLGRAKIHSRVGGLYRDLGRFPEARAALTAAESTFVPLVAADPADVTLRRELAYTLQSLAGLLRKTGDPAGAVNAYRRVADLEAIAVPGAANESGRLVAALGNVAVALREAGRADEAIAVLRECVARSRHRLAGAPADIVLSSILALQLSNLGICLNEAGRSDEAISVLAEAVTAYEAAVTAFPTVVTRRTALADAANNFGLALDAAGRTDEAVTAMRRARDIRAGLAHDFPDLPVHRFQFAQAQCNLAGVLVNAHRDQVESELGAALAILDRLVADFPTVPEYRMQLAIARTNRGLNTTAQRPADAVAHFDRAIALVTERADVLLKTAENRHSLADAHAGRAAALAALRRHADAANDWDRAVALAPDRLKIQVNRAKALAHAGDPTAASRAADEIVRTAGASKESLYGAAVVYAVAAGHIRDDPARANLLAGNAVTLLRRAAVQGYATLTILLDDPDLRSIRGRPDYAVLMWDLADGPTAK